MKYTIYNNTFCLILSFESLLEWKPFIFLSIFCLDMSIKKCFKMSILLFCKSTSFGCLRTFVWHWIVDQDAPEKSWQFYYQIQIESVILWKVSEVPSSSCHYISREFVLAEHKPPNPIDAKRKMKFNMKNNIFIINDSDCIYMNVGRITNEEEKNHNIG